MAHLLATRLCHDLSGPLSGLAAALGEMPGDPEALPLALDAAQVLRQRMALLRAAWGGVQAPIACSGLRELAGWLPNAARLRIDVDLAGPDEPIAGTTVRLLVNVLLLAAESLPGGGALQMSGNPGGQVVVGIAGRRAAWPPGFGALLASADAARQAASALSGTAGLRGVQAVMTALLAHHAGARAALLLAATTEQAPPLLLDLGNTGK
jgi:histidine phosphotransferase ChpT